MGEPAKPPPASGLQATREQSSGSATEIDPVLMRLIERMSLSVSEPPDPETWARFLGKLNRRMGADRQDREQLERARAAQQVELFTLREQLDVVDKGELGQERKKLEAIIDAVGEALVAFDDEGHVLLLNNKARRVLAVRKHTSARELFEQIDLPDQSGADLLEKAVGGTYLADLDAFFRGDVRSFPISLTIAPFRDDVTSLRGFVVVTRDETERKQAQEALAQALNEAEKAAQAKSDFLATMSHEIRTPMNGVMGMMELLVASGLTTEQREYAQTVTRSAEALLEIINDILDFAKIEAGKLQLEVISFDLRSLMEEVAGLLSTKSRSKGIQLGSFVHRDIPAKVYGDPTRMRQILLNLAGNAVKFTQEGSVMIRCVPTDDDSDTLRIEVRDTGIGIPEDRVASLFVPFEQVDSSTTRKFGGTGLGLAITKQLVEAMNGELQVSSVFGEGSTFFFDVELPADKSVLVEKSLAGRRFLILDPDQVHGQVAAEQVASLGANAEVVTDKNAAARQLRDGVRNGQPFDACLFTVRGKIRSGAFASWVRAKPGLGETVLVALAPPVRHVEAEALRRRGVDEVVLVPIRHNSLERVLRRVSGEAERRRSMMPPPMAAAKTFADKRVLVVEDNMVNQLVARKLLEKLECTVTIANHGEEALKKLDEGTFDIVLMDCQMPVMDGFDATRCIRGRTTPDAELPVIALTANAMPGDIEKCHAAGMDGYLSKPVTLDGMRDKLAEYLGE